MRSAGHKSLCLTYIYDRIKKPPYQNDEVITVSGGTSGKLPETSGNAAFRPVVLSQAKRTLEKGRLPAQ